LTPLKFKKELIQGIPREGGKEKIVTRDTGAKGLIDRKKKQRELKGRHINRGEGDGRERTGCAFDAVDQKTPH